MRSIPLKWRLLISVALLIFGVLGFVDITAKTIPLLWASDRAAAVFMAFAELHLGISMLVDLLKWASPDRSPSDA